MMSQERKPMASVRGGQLDFSTTKSLGRPDFCSRWTLRLHIDRFCFSLFSAASLQAAPKSTVFLLAMLIASFYKLRTAQHSDSRWHVDRLRLYTSYENNKHLR